MGKQKIVFTNHALDRAQEIGMPKDKAYLTKIFLQAEQYRKNVGRELYKLEKYGSDSENITYWHTKKLRFTVKETEDAQVIITITSKKRSSRRSELSGSSSYLKEYVDEKV